MVLRRDGDAKRLHPRQVIGSSDEGVLDAPAALDDGVFPIGALVCGQHQIDGGVADGVGGDPPPSPVHLTHDRRVAFRVDRLQSTERPFVTPWLFVRRAHQSAFEAAIHRELDAAGAQPLVTLIRLEP